MYMETTTKDTNKVYTREYFVRMGKIGGKKTREKYGTNHYSKINPKKNPKNKGLDKGVV